MLFRSSEPFSENIEGYVWIGDFNGHSYYRSTESSYWTVAKDRADAVRGGYLVVITSQEEFNFIVSRNSDFTSWIGLYQDTKAENYSEPDSAWRWVPSISETITKLPDGILGNSPVKVDEYGRVIQSADGTTSEEIGRAHV